MTKPWADQPFALVTETGVLSRKDVPPDHPAVYMAQQMAHSHNVIVRGLNASVNQCLGVQPGTTEAGDFLVFNQCLIEILQQHHDVEETYMFGAIEGLTKVDGIMDQNLQEHKDFHDGLDRFRKYIFETTAADYDGQTFKTLLEAFGKALEKHLHNEIPTLINLKDYDASAVQKISKEAGKRFANVGDRFRHVPIFVGCSDKSFVLDGENVPFPPLPFFVPYFIKFIMEPRYAGAWRFNPCDTFGKPRPLNFPNPEN